MNIYLEHKIFRLIHFNNLEEILQNGMYSKNSGHIVPNYFNIGDTSLIRQRESYNVRIDPPNGNLGDYIPFYFAGHSPMLLNIKTGYRGVQKLPQEELIFLACKISDILNKCSQWCFTDGHAKSTITKFYNNPEHLALLDWNMIHQRYWHPTEEDMDRTRRKQAEFLVKTHVPVDCISEIIVLNEKQEERIKEIEEKLKLNIPVYVDKKYKYFYP